MLSDSRDQNHFIPGTVFQFPVATKSTAHVLRKNSEHLQLLEVRSKISILLETTEGISFSLEVFENILFTI